MLRGLLLLIIIAGVAGYFTRPDESKMRSAADAMLNEPANLAQGLQGLGATLAGERKYDNYYVAARYAVTLNGDVLVDCWGAFTQTKCQRGAAPATQ
ncbi:MAG: hypothetical protein AB7L65_01815 [Hyphomonadaceae bacterium]